MTAWTDFINNPSAERVYLVRMQVAHENEGLNWDLLYEDCSDISDWDDIDYDTGVSEVSPVGQFRFDTNLGAAGNAYAARIRDIGSFPNTFSIEIKLKHDKIGTLADSDFFLLDCRQTDECFRIKFCSDGLFITTKSAGGSEVNTEVGIDLVKSGDGVEWQTWRFLVTFTGTPGEGICDIYVNDSSRSWEKVGLAIPCSDVQSFTDGQTALYQYGNTTDDIVTHVDRIKIISGLIIPPEISTKTLYLATHPKEFTHYYHPCVIGIPRFNRSAQEMSVGWSMPSWGELVLLCEDDYSLTPDGIVTFDDIISGNWECGGRDIEILFGGDDLAESDYQTIMKGMVDKVESWQNNKISISIADWQGKLEKKIVAKNKVNTNNDRFKNPSGIVTSTDDVYLFVTDTEDHRIVKRLTTDLAFCTALGSYGPDDNYPDYVAYNPGGDEFKYPQGVCYYDNDGGSNNAIYITDTINHRIVKRHVHDPERIGIHMWYWFCKGSQGSNFYNDEFESPIGIACDQETPAPNVFITDTGNHRLTKWINMSRDSTIGSLGTGNDQFSSPAGVCCDDTHVFITDTGNHRIVKRLKSDMSYVSQVGSRGSGNNQFESPSFLTCDDTYLYITDTGNHRIVKRLKSDHLHYVSQVGSQGPDNDQFQSPAGIACNSTNLFVTDTENHRIIKLLKDLTYVSTIGSVSTGLDFPYAPQAALEKTIPFCIGDCRNVTPILVNKTTARRYLMHDVTIAPMEDIVAVYAGGIPLPGDEWVNEAENGTFQVPVEHEGKITCDVKGFKFEGNYVQYFGDIARALLILCGGINAFDISDTDIDTINAAYPCPLGAYITGEDSVLDVLDQLIKGIPAMYGFSREGIFEIKEFVAPEGEPDISLGTREIMPGMQGGSSDIYHKVTIKYDNNPNVMSSVSTAVPDDLATWLRDAWREFVSKDPEILALNPLAKEIDFETALRESGDAEAIGAIWLTLLANKRFELTFKVKSPALRCHLGDVVKITFPKFGLSSGVLHRVIGIEENYSQNEYIITAWR